jgi:hypothetical protein
LYILTIDHIFQIFRTDDLLMLNSGQIHVSLLWNKQYLCKGFQNNDHDTTILYTKNLLNRSCHEVKLDFRLEVSVMIYADNPKC